MDVVDKVLGVIIILAVVAIGLPIGFGFFADGNYTLTIGDTTFNSAPLMVLLAVVLVFAVVYLGYKHIKGGK
jgi:hypothetical protein